MWDNKASQLKGAVFNGCAAQNAQHRKEQANDMDFNFEWNAWADAHRFSGVFSVTGKEGTVFEAVQGFRNKSEQLLNNRDTSFGIASGTKLFTGLAVCRLIDQGKLSLDDLLWKVLPYDLGQINRQVSIHHLLTHTSGIGDYIDEESPNDVQQMQALYSQYPVYLWEELEYYLPMITPLPQKFAPGARFGYSNAGFVLLGLVIEAVSGMPYQEYVTTQMIAPLGLRHTGFYRTDALPKNTALGYIYHEPSGQWRTNSLSLPVVGGADGGLYTCADDLAALWRGVFSGHVLSPKMLQIFTAPHKMRDKNKSYGLGVYRCDANGTTAYYAVGSDFGVSFFTIYLPEQNITASALANCELSTGALLNAILCKIGEQGRGE